MRRRLAALAACLALGGCGGEDTRPDAAARLVPADALAYVHVDLADHRLGELAARVPSLQRLVAALGDLAGDDVEEWVGGEAAVALLDSGAPAADTLLLLEVSDAEAARREARGSDGIQARMAGDFLAIGQPRVVRRAVELSQGRGDGLERTVGGAADAWLPATGLRRLLGSQPGLLGALGAALDDPRLRHVTATAKTEDDGLRITVRRARRGTYEAPVFEPELLERVPADAAGYLGLAGARPLLERIGLGSLRLGEVAIWVRPGAPVPVLSAAAEVADERAARDAVARALGRLAEWAAGGQGGESGRIPQIEERRLPGGITASVLPLAPGVEVAVAVSEGHLLASTAPAAIARVPDADDSLREDERFRRVVPRLPDEVEALGFADLAKLLTLGEQAGLAGGSLAGAADALRRFRAIGATAEREGSDTNAEFFLEIP